MVEDSEKSLDSRKKELSEKYKIDFNKLEREQLELFKELDMKDKIDFSLAERFGAIDVTFIKNKMLCCFIVCDKDFEIIDRAYVFDKVRFPYFPGFRNYRELPVMMAAFEKLSEKPDVVFISGQGVIHPRLGLASHFGLSTGVPSIGVSSSLVDCKVEGDSSKENFEKIGKSKFSNENFDAISSGNVNQSKFHKDGADVLKDNKKAGKVLVTKAGSNPMFISPGDHISVKSAYEVSKRLINLPHKRPEPMHLASKYAKEVREELMSGG